MEGWIKIHRKLLQWEWYNDSKMVHLFLHLLLSANHDEKKWQGKTIKRGQLITGRMQLSSATGISQQSIRTCLDRLVECDIVTIKTTNKYSVITILKYDSYQIKENANQELTNKVTNNQPTTNQQLTTNKKDKKDKKDINNFKSWDEEEFKQSMRDVADDVKGMDRNKAAAFFNYWSEPDSKGKMKFQLQKTWDTKRRMVTWVNNNFGK